MINPGDTLVNSVTGEELTFLQTAASTNGEYVEIVAVVQPGGSVAAAHVHPKPVRDLHRHRGHPRAAGRSQAHPARAGESAVVEAGTAHKFWNAGDEPVMFHCVISPALQFESLIETMFAPRPRRQDESQGHAEPGAHGVHRPRASRRHPPRRRPGLAAGPRHPQRDAAGVRRRLRRDLQAAAVRSTNPIPA